MSRAYDLIINLPRARALGFHPASIARQAPGSYCGPASITVREAAHAPANLQPEPTANGSAARIPSGCRQVQQKEVSDDALRREFGDLTDLRCSDEAFTLRDGNGCLTTRNRAIGGAFEPPKGFPARQSAHSWVWAKPSSRNAERNINSITAVVRHCSPRKRGRTARSTTKRYEVLFFSLLHEPPANHGINRTTWTMPITLSGPERGQRDRDWPGPHRQNDQGCRLQMRKGKSRADVKRPDLRGEAGHLIHQT